MSIRADKVSSVIKKSLSRPISEIAEEKNAGLVTITSVRLSRDLSVAKIYVSIYGGKTTPAAFINVLEAKAGYIRSILGRNIRTRKTPEIRFFLDDTLDQMDKIQDLLDSVKKTEQTEDNNDAE